MKGTFNFVVRRRQRALSVLTVAVTAPLLAAGCSSSSSGASGTAGIAVKASDTGCTLATTTFRSGTLTFSVSNEGSQVTGFYVYAPGDRVLGEVENIGPSTSKKLTVALKAGQYQIACKPGMVGKGVRTPFTVKAPSGVAPTTSPQLDAAVAAYRDYVEGKVELLATLVRPFVAAVQAGDIAKAKALYPSARVPYEQIKPITQSFGDLDSRIDARIDTVEVGQPWTGFHRLEHDLWKTADISADRPVAAQLESDVAKLVAQVQTVQLSADEISTGAKSLLAEVAASKVTGAEERYSGLDLVDFEANVQGAQAAYQAVRPVVATAHAALVAKLDARFATMLSDLAQYGQGSSFRLYDTLSQAEIHVLAADVAALNQPLADLTAAVLKA